jgi:hypothetical protein
MRRNVRRLNREIGNHGSSLPVSTQVSLPLTLPTSYQPRSQEKKIINTMKSTVQTSDSEAMSIQPPSVPVAPYNMAMSNVVAGDSSAFHSHTTGDVSMYAHSPQMEAVSAERKILRLFNVLT